MKSKILLSFLFSCFFNFLFTVFCFSQAKNMVMNPGFEEYYKCPESHNQEDQSHKIVPGWSYPTFAAPDYFNRCGTNDGGVPQNFAGNSNPQEGNGYVGSILTGSASMDKENRREYIQGELMVPMVAGQKYCITFYYRLASGSRLAVDQVGIYISAGKISTEGFDALPVVPQLVSLPGLFLDDVEDWQQICHVYDARGGEKFVIIGNFKNYETTNYVVTDKNVVNLRNKAYAYYYFDNISVKMLDNCNDCPCVKHDFDGRVIDSSYTGGRNPLTGEVKRIVNDGYIKLAAIGGTPPYKYEWSNKAKTHELKNLAAGTYTYTISDFFNCKVRGAVTFVQPEIVVDNFEEGLKNIEEGSSVVLENIFFAFNKTELLPESYAELDKVAAFMLELNIKKIEISGHTDSDGSDVYNQKLSEGRAKAVVDYLALKGIDLTRMDAKGYGETRPIDTNLTDSGKAQNRRVEFTLIKK